MNLLPMTSKLHKIFSKSKSLTKCDIHDYFFGVWSRWFFKKEKKKNNEWFFKKRKNHKWKAFFFTFIMNCTQEHMNGLLSIGNRWLPMYCVIQWQWSDIWSCGCLLHHCMVLCIGPIPPILSSKIPLLIPSILVPQQRPRLVTEIFVPERPWPRAPLSNFVIKNMDDRMRM